MLLVQPLAVGLLPLLLRLLEVALGSGACAGQGCPQALQQRGLLARAARVQAGAHMQVGCAGAGLRAGHIICEAAWGHLQHGT